jgi:hypothetical protein
MSYEMSSVSKLNKKGSTKADAAGTGELNSSKDNSREVLFENFLNYSTGTSTWEEKCTDNY